MDQNRPNSRRGCYIDDKRTEGGSLGDPNLIMIMDNKTHSIASALRFSREKGPWEFFVGDVEQIIKETDDKQILACLYNFNMLWWVKPYISYPLLLSTTEFVNSMMRRKLTRKWEYFWWLMIGYRILTFISALLILDI